MHVNKKELGLLLKNARKIKGDILGEKYTQHMLARDINKSQSFIGDIEAGRSYPSFALLCDIASACGVSINYFEKIQPPKKDLLSEVSLPILSDIELETLTNLFKDEITKPLSYSEIINIPLVEFGGSDKIHIGYYPLSKYYIDESKSYFATELINDSMDIELKLGSMLIFENTTTFENDTIVLALLNNNEILIHRMSFSENTILLAPNSNNSKHTKITLDKKNDNLKIIGHLILAISRF